MKTINKILKSKKGFTLIELVVVIAVLGMIAVVAVPKIAGITDKAKTNSDAQTIAILNEAVERYVAESGDDDLEGNSGEADAKDLGDMDNATDAIKVLSEGVTFDGTKYGPYLDESTSSKLPSDKTKDLKWNGKRFSKD